MDNARGSTLKIQAVTHKAFILDTAGATGTPANSLLVSGREGQRIVLVHLGFSNSASTSNNIAMQWSSSGGAPADPDVSMDTIFIRETLPAVGVTLRNLITCAVASEENQDLHGWLDGNSTGWFVNIGYAYLEVPS